MLDVSCCSCSEQVWPQGGSAVTKTEWRRRRRRRRGGGDEERRDISSQQDTDGGRGDDITPETSLIHTDGHMQTVNTS